MINNKKILISGNEAIAEAAIASGCEFYAGYPITPQNELIAHMAKRMPEENRVFIQSESEIAAINMVFGAAAAGVRAMTSSSSPGISLKQEGISYLAGAELPCLIVNMMRGGPGLGNIAPAQSDYFQATKGGGHGDYHLIVLAPSNIEEAVRLVKEGFDLADKYRNPVMILGDGILGQMMEPIEKRKLQGEKRKTTDKPWALTGCKDRKPNIIKSFYMAENALEEFNKKLQKKYALIKTQEQKYESLGVDDAKIILVAYGTMARICKNIVKDFRKSGKKIGLIRPISLWPFPHKAFDKILNSASGGKKTRFLVVEMSGGQMVEDVKLSINARAEVDFFGRTGGGVPQEEEIIKKINQLIK